MINEPKMLKEEVQNYCARDSSAQYIRNKARRLRERSVKLDKLADQLERGNISGEAEEALWDELTRMRDR